MNKRRLLVLVLLMVATLVLSTCLFVACNKAAVEEEQKSEPTTIEATSGLPIANSDFKVVGTTDDSYPKSPTSWTGAAASSSLPSDVIAGIINIDKDVYDANKATWSDSENAELYNKLTENGDRYAKDGTLYTILKNSNLYNKKNDNDEDVLDEEALMSALNNIMMVYMPEKSAITDKEKYGPTAYAYTSTSFTLDKSSYYRLSIDVLTYNIKGDEEKEVVEPGARLYVSSATYGEFAKINTNGEWKTYNFFFETAPSSTSLTVALSLGNYSSTYTYGLTTGYAFFDNIILEKVEKAGYETAVTAEKTNEYFQTNSILVSNGRFDFGTTSLGTSSTPSNWTLVTGNSSETDAAPTGKGYNGIIDISKWATDYTKYSGTYYIKTDASTTKDYVFAKNLENVIADDSAQSITTLPADVIGTKVYMLSQQMMTAQGIKSSKAITIEKNKLYALSINLYTFGIHGNGVSLVLTGDNTKDITIKGISQNKSTDVLIGSQAIDLDNNSYALGSESLGASNGQWTTYTFYILGNQFYDYTYTYTIWLGTEGTNSNNEKAYTKYSSSSSTSDTTYDANGTFSTGWVFIDDAKLKDVTGETIDYSNVKQIAIGDEMTLDIAADATKTGIKVDLSTVNNFFDNNQLKDFTGTASNDKNLTTVKGSLVGWESKFDTTKTTNPIIYDDVNGQAFITDGIVDLTSEETFNASFTNGTAVSEYPATPYALANNYAYVISASQDSYYEIQSAPFIIPANTYNRISLWVKTVDVKSTSGLYVYLKNVDKDAALATISTINTKDADEYTNNWVELTFYIKGANTEDTNVYFLFTLGTGTRWSATTLTTGSAYIANTNYSTITYKAYDKAATGTYTKSIDLSSSYTYTFTNGGFDEYDEDDDNLVADQPLNKQEVAAKPENWTISDEKLDANKVGSPLVAGVVALKEKTGTLHDGLYFEGSDQTAVVFPAIDFTEFYGDTTSADYLSKINMETIGGPNVLAIASKDATKYAVGFESSSISLSANTNYKISVYAKTYGTTTASIYLTGETSGQAQDSYFKIANTADSLWTKYTFLIQVGNSSCSLKLNLWLGQNKDYIDVDGADDAEKTENAKSAGVVFFDTVSYKTIDDDTYKAAVADGTTKKISLLVDGFDSLSSSISSRSSLTSPNGWSGSVDTNQDSSNTKSGVAYVDSKYLETDVDNYIKVLGKDLKLEDFEVTAEELQADSRYSSYEGNEDELVEIMRQEKLDAAKAANLVTVTNIAPKSGKQLLIINNTDESAYKYTSNSSITFKEESYYKVTVWVNTYALNAGEETGAYIELYLGNANVEDEPFIFKAIKANVWTPYTFYVKTGDDDVTSASLKLSLGKYYEANEDGKIPSLTSGYAMFDDVSIELLDEFTETDFEAMKTAAETDSTILCKEALINKSGEADDDDEEDEGDVTKPSFNLEYLWWMIPTIILGALSLVAVVVLAVRKIKKARKVKADNTVESEGPVTAKAVDEIRSKYDSNKE